MEGYHVLWADLQKVDYELALGLMNSLRDRVSEQGSPGYILFLEHPHTITLGYSLKGDEGRGQIKSTESELLAEGVKVIRVDRGGKATYHGPGQLICYLIVSLRGLRLGVKRYVGKLMDAVLASLEELGVDAEIDPAYPGVWVGGAKLAAVGIRVSNDATTHGFAINLDPDLTKFRHIVPCGIADKPVTSLFALGAEVPERETIIKVLLMHLEHEFKLGLEKTDPSQIWSLDREAQ